MFARLIDQVVGGINGALPNGTENVQAIFQLTNDGTYSISGQSAGNWVTPASSAVAAQWQVKVDVTAGGFDTGTTGSWVDLSSTQQWVCNAAGSSAAIFTVSFRDKATLAIRSVQTGVELTAL